jgi:hypothetical protein
MNKQPLATTTTKTKPTDFFNVCVVEDHNDALSFIYKEIGARRLKFSNLVMIHFDSHPDLGIPMTLQADLVFDKAKLFDNLSIENWIVPAVYAGHLETLVWVKPSWAAQINAGEYTIVVGKDPETGGIRCNCKEGYFLSESLYVNEKHLVNKREFTLYVCDYDSMLSRRDSFLLNLFKSAKTADKRFILDIDLDFFSTKDPFKEMFATKEEYDLFKKVYSMKFETGGDFDSDFEIFVNTKRVRMEKVFAYLSQETGERSEESDFIGEEKRNLDEFADVVRANKIDLEIIHSYGCAIDEITLPHHVTDSNELSKMLDNFDAFLNKYFSSHLMPSAVTIARSSLDGYCPIEQVEFIQEQVLSKLKLYFKTFLKNVEMDY